MDEPRPQRPHRACSSYSVSGRVKEPGRQARAGRHHGARADRRVSAAAWRRATASGLSPGRRLGRHPAGLDGRHPARFRDAGEVRLLHRLGRGRDPLGPGRPARRGAQPDALLRGRVLRPVHALPGRDAEGGRPDGAAALGPGASRRARRGDARRLDLRPRPGGAEPACCASCAISPKSSPPWRPPNERDGPASARRDHRLRARRRSGRGRVRARRSGRSPSVSAPRSRISATRRSPATGRTAIAAPAWSRSRASACSPPPACASPASA